MQPCARSTDQPIRSLVPRPHPRLCCATQVTWLNAFCWLSTIKKSLNGHQTFSLWEGGIWARDYSAYGMERGKLRQTQCKLSKRKLVNQCFVTCLIAIETKQPQQATLDSYYGTQLCMTHKLSIQLVFGSISLYDSQNFQFLNLMICCGITDEEGGWGSRTQLVPRRQHNRKTDGWYAPRFLPTQQCTIPTI